MIEKERVMSIAKQRRSEGEGWWDRMDLLVSLRCSSWGSRGRLAGKLSPLRLIFSASGSSVDLFVWAMVACGAMHTTAMSFPFPRCYLAAGSTSQLSAAVCCGLVMPASSRAFAPPMKPPPLHRHDYEKRLPLHRHDYEKRLESSQLWRVSHCGVWLAHLFRRACKSI